MPRGVYPHKRQHHNRFRHIDDAAIVAFQRDHRDLTCAEIGDRFGIKPDMANDILLKAGVTRKNYLRKKDKIYRVYIRKYHAAIVALTKSHPSMTRYAVTLEVGCALSTVCVTWQDIGWERRFKRCKFCGVEAVNAAGTCWRHWEIKEKLPLMMLPEDNDWVKETTIKRRLSDLSA
jgi:hypothetical protein